MELQFDKIKNITFAQCPYRIPGFPLSVRKVDSEWGKLLHVPHWHEDFEFIYQAVGCAKFKINSKTITLQEGQAVIINIGDFQCAAPANDEHYLFYRINFTSDLLCFGNNNDSWALKLLAPVLRKEYRLPSHISGCYSWEKEILIHLSRIIDAFYSNLPGYQLDISSSVCRIFSELLNNKTLKKAVKKDMFFDEDKSSRLYTIISYIDENLHEKFTVDDIAAQLNMSSSNFMHFFKEILSISPIQYISHRRINKACELLSTTEYTISDIATKTGFDDLSYFSKIFKEHKGCTPKEYRTLYYVGTQELPEHWHNTDIGNVAIPGSSKYNHKMFVIRSSGWDIWLKEDSFHFVYIKLLGDCSISARVNSIQKTDSWAKAGVMIRNTLKASSAFAHCCLSPSGYTSFQWREEYKNDTYSSAISDMKAPVYLKVSKVKNNITAYYSNNEADWIQIGESISINANKSVYVGLAVSSHKFNIGTLCTATFDNITVRSKRGRITKY